MLSENSKLITIVGTNVVPEFGVMTMTILGIAIASILFVGKKCNYQKDSEFGFNLYWLLKNLNKS